MTQINPDDNLDSHVEDHLDDNLHQLFSHHDYGIVQDTAERRSPMPMILWLGIAAAAVITIAMVVVQWPGDTVPGQAHELVVHQGNLQVVQVFPAVEGQQSALLLDRTSNRYFTVQSGTVLGSVTIDQVSDSGVQFRSGSAIKVNPALGRNASPVEFLLTRGHLSAEILTFQDKFLQRTLTRQDLATLTDKAYAGDSGAMALLYTITQTGGNAEADAALRTLAGDSDLKGVMRLLAAASNPNSPVRDSMIAELAQVPSPLALTALRVIASNAQDPSQDVALRLLLQSDRKETLPLLETALTREDLPEDLRRRLPERIAELKQH